MSVKFESLTNTIERLLHKIHVSDAYIYRVVLYGCTAMLVSFALLTKISDVDVTSYIIATAFASIYALGKLGKSPEYARKQLIDPLTNLLNREGFIASLERAIAEYPKQPVKSPIVVFIIDITNFNNFNKALGYALSDRILKLVAEKITATVSGRDIVARIGVDEFGVILNSATLGYMTVSERLYAALSEPSKLTDDISVTVGAASGIPGTRYDNF